MTHAPMLLRAIASVDGEAMVLHPGDKPYIVAPGRRIMLSSRPLTVERLTALMEELLPAAALAALEESGAVQWELPPSSDLPDGRFIVVAAHVEHELWAEVRRYVTNPTGTTPSRSVQRGSNDLHLPPASELWPSE